jgi:hypothetical protein
MNIRRLSGVIDKIENVPAGKLEFIISKISLKILDESRISAMR